MVEQTWRFLGHDFFAARDEFEDADLVIGEDEEGSGWIEGEYTTRRETRLFAFDLERTGRLFSEGLLSSRVQNRTAFFCDSVRSELWGTALHDLDLRGGELTFADGEALRYGLAPLDGEDEE